MSKIKQPQIYYGEVIDINSDTYELTNTESNSNINTLFTVKVLIKDNPELMDELELKIKETIKENNA